MIQPTSLAQQVYAVIAGEILTGKRTRGSPLLEQELARSLNVSRTPIREALRRLAGDGLVEIRLNYGAIVRSLSPLDVANIYDVREALECKAIELACVRFTDDDIATIEDLLAKLGDPTDPRQRQRWNKFDAALHDLIATRSGNELLAREIARFRDLMMLLRDQLSFSKGAVRLAAEQHAEIIAALKKRDPARSSMLMRKHIRTFAELHVKMLRESEDST
jgi:DNA-binding GntR family transcriptional regulator